MLPTAPAPRARYRAGRALAALVAAAGLGLLSPGAAGAACTPLPCSQLIAPTPHILDFASDHGGVRDGAGAGTGFTYVDPTGEGGGYEPSRLSTGGGLLRIRTAGGTSYLGDNSLENALAIGVPAAAKVFSVRAIVDRPAPGTGSYEQAGIWVGVDQDNYVKLVILSNRSGPGLQVLGEAGGENSFPAPATRRPRRFVPVAGLEAARVTLLLRVDVAASTVAGFYALGGGEPKPVGTFAVPPELLTGGGRVDQVLAGGRLAGVAATHRRGPGPLEYSFDGFDLVCHNAGCPVTRPDPGPGDLVGDDSGEPGGRGDGDLRRVELVTGRSGQFTSSLRHPRRIRASRLLKRGLAVTLDCSERCAMRARLHGSRRWESSVGLAARRSGVTLGAGRVRAPGLGAGNARLKVFPGMKRRLRRVLPRQLTIVATVRTHTGRRLTLRSSVRILPRTRSPRRG
jgi:hypothetical protein